MDCYQSKLTGDDKHFQPEYKALKVNHFKLLSSKYFFFRGHGSRWKGLLQYGTNRADHVVLAVIEIGLLV